MIGQATIVQRLGHFYSIGSWSFQSRVDILFWHYKKKDYLLDNMFSGFFSSFKQG